MGEGLRDRPAGHVDGPDLDVPAAGGRRPGELGARELGRWTWRQVTSMRTALVLLLLLALAAVPGSVIPQENVDSLEVSRWKTDHPSLTPVYERLGLFSVYDSPWFSAIYILLMVSLVGCIVPRTFVYARALRAQPPATPRNLARLPDHTTFTTDLDPDAVVARAREVLEKRRYRLRAADPADDDASVSAEKGFVREAGNLLFHVSVIVVLVGFAIGGLFGYQGGVIVLVGGQPFTNTAASYDDLDPGSMFGADDFDPFSFRVEDFDLEWLTEGSGAGTARKFEAQIAYREQPGSEEKSYNLRVNHPLTIGDTDVFLIGHGYAPVITVRDGNGDIAYRGPTIFLPTDPSFQSLGVVKAPGARPQQIGLEGILYPTYFFVDGNPTTQFPALGRPLISMLAWTGDLGLDAGVPQSVYVLDTETATPLEDADGKQVRVDLFEGETEQLPGGLGSVTFEGVEPWVRVQVSQTPGKELALLGVVLALIGLLGSLYIRPRRVWVRARRVTGDDAQGGTMVEVALLDRSGGADLSSVLDDLVSDLQATPTGSGTRAKETP